MIENKELHVLDRERSEDVVLGVSVYSLILLREYEITMVIVVEVLGHLIWGFAQRCVC